MSGGKDNPRDWVLGSGFGRWVDRNILDLGRQMRLAYLPPLMVYVAAGISGLTAIVGTFFVKDYLGLSAEFLAMLGFWAGIPWVLKMPLGHLVDLIWRWKAVLVFFGASLIAVGLLIMLGLLGHRETMVAILPVESWYVLSVLLTPVGYVVQDVVADAMTVEAVPRVNALGQPFDSAQLKLMHTTMQTLGRVAIIGGSVLVALANILMFGGVEALTQAQKAAIYFNIYQMALAIPVISVTGVILGELLQYRRARRLRAQGYSRKEVQAMLSVQEELPSPNMWILGGSFLFVIFSIAIGFSDNPFNQEIVFAGSLGNRHIFDLSFGSGFRRRSAANTDWHCLDHLRIPWGAYSRGWSKLVADRCFGF